MFSLSQTVERKQRKYVTVQISEALRKKQITEEKIVEIRKAQEKDLETLLKIYAHAREFMAKTGNPDQWKSSYPDEEKVSGDIAQGVCYVCVQDGEIEGVFSYLQGPDPTYQKIDDGKWLNEDPYGVVHRVAGRGHVHGVADRCLAWAFDQCGNLRIDTHRDNRVMQHILEKNGFTVCGTIYVADGSPRIAYQKVRGKNLVKKAPDQKESVRVPEKEPLQRTGEKESQDVLEYLKREIRRGRLKEGDRLPTERQLSEKLNVSRTTVRDAMRLLEGMGVLVSRQGSGNYLSGKMEKSLAEMLEFMILLKEMDYGTVNQLRRAIGLWNYREVMKHHTPEQVLELRQILGQMQQEKQKEICDEKFHEKLLEFGGNPLILMMMNALSGVCRELIRNAFVSMSEEEEKKLEQSHWDMLDALVGGRMEEGCAAVMEHYDLVDREIEKWKETEQK